MKFKDLKLNDRVWFNSPLSKGHRETGTVIRIDTDEHLHCPVVWIKWDSHKMEIGELCTTGDEYELSWELCSNQKVGLTQWMEEEA